MVTIDLGAAKKKAAAKKKPEKKPPPPEPEQETLPPETEDDIPMDFEPEGEPVEDRRGEGNLPAGPNSFGGASAPGDITGDYDESMFKADRVNLVQKTGDLAGDFAPGSLVYNREVILTHVNPDDTKTYGESTTFCIISQRLQYQENISFDPDNPPDIVDTMDEVLARDGTTKYEGDIEPTWKPLQTLDALFLAETEHAKEEFTLAGPDEELYETAKWSLSGTAFTRVAKVTNHKVAKLLKKDPPLPCYGIWFSVKFREEKVNGNWIFVPKVTVGKLLTPEMREWIKEEF